MKKNSIEIIVKNNLCIGCGVCKGICPASSISFLKKNGMYLPVIDEKNVMIVDYVARCVRDTVMSILKVKIIN